MTLALYQCLGFENRGAPPDEWDYLILGRACKVSQRLTLDCSLAEPSHKLSVVREPLDRLLRDLTLVTLALGIALGWALFQVAEGVSRLISTALVDASDSDGRGVFARGLIFSEPLTWEVGGRVLTFGPLFQGLVELAVVLVVAMLVRAHSQAREA